MKLYYSLLGVNNISIKHIINTGLRKGVKNKPNTTKN